MWALCLFSAIASLVLRRLHGGFAGTTWMTSRTGPIQIQPWKKKIKQTNNEKINLSVT